MNELLRAEIFKGFTGWNAIAFLGAITPKLLKFEITEGEKTRPLYLASVISRDEKPAWQSFQDLLDHSAALAQPGLQGLFGLDVLSVDIHGGVRDFNPQDLSKLLVNHSRAFGAAHRTLVRYGQLFCVLHKRAPADWGRIEVRTHVEIVDPEKTKLETFVKKIRRESGGEAGAIYLVHDMSAKSAWSPAGPSSIMPGDIHIYRSSAKEGA